MLERSASVTKSSQEYSFRTPRELAVSETEVKRILVIGSCTSQGIYHYAHRVFPRTEVDHILYNFPGVDESNLPRPASEYDFQFIYLPLRTVVPETMLANISHESEEPFIAKFEEAKNRLLQTLNGALKYTENSNLLTFVSEFLAPQQSLFGRLLPRHDFRNPTYFVEQLNKVLHEIAAERANTHVVQTDSIASTFGKKFIQEDLVWPWSHASYANDWDSVHDTKRIAVPTKLSDLYPFNTQDFILAIWSEIDAMYRTIRQQDSVKLVIVDLDDTVWRGVVAEEGIHPYILEGWPLGMIETLKYLKHRGIVLAIVSKNEEARITELWPDILGGRLALDDFAIRKINWRPKAENIQEILTYTNLLPKNVLFIDDNPVERQSVQAAFPTIRTLGEELYAIRRILLWAPELQVPYISQESSRRTQMIQDQVKRETAKSGMNREDFLASLGVKVAIREITDISHASFPRAFELLNKSNQFNTTGKRWSIEECSRAFADGWKFSTFEVQDNYSSYGLVGVAILNGSYLDQFVMSCRVVGLGVESAVIRFLYHHGDLKSGRIVETEANLIVRDLFQKCGFYYDGVHWVTDGDFPESYTHVTITAA
ncbi:MULTISPECIES: HAD-IIIC family phosphatase [unclassified Rhizobium]|uniref:HAD-IIIC family phosphatase n=1 Tax=unclassified Rhizobium TaxID=2613769 RepID=UPI0016228102|nr:MULTISPECIES: HAD-IIIC family phosphatase [unclassified Rhizobium]MBB3387000.1 FkbH-like protein [Rhizobium sp. BK098]MBB3618677.1 FkbH-like protein [Rhizobium sp. BK609]MBB3684361.1 FkbH-like protein [Rhizobium sp. BK612]